MSKVKDAVTLAMLLVAIVFSAGLLTLPEYSSAGLDVSGLSSAAPEGETYRPNVTSPPVSSVAPPAVTPEPLYTERDSRTGEMSEALISVALLSRRAYSRASGSREG